MMVHIAVRGDNRNMSEILGAFADREAAISHCKKQPTYTRQDWQEDGDVWHNGHGLYVRVISCEVK